MHLLLHFGRADRQRKLAGTSVSVNSPTASPGIRPRGIQIHSANDQPESQARKPVVLIADDNEDIRDLLTTRLGVRGYEVIATADGQAALDVIHERLPDIDIAVLDWVMPGIQGHELCVKLKTDPRTRSLPVIILTARGEEEDRLLGLDLGADAYVVKPFNIDELDELIRRLLEADRPPSAGFSDLLL